MKAYSVSQIKAFEKKAIEDFGISPLILMENAGLRVADFISDKIDLGPNARIAIVCGSGNNGGDGFVAARHLMNKRYAVDVFVLAGGKKAKAEAGINLHILSKMKANLFFPGLSIPDKSFEKQIKRYNLIVDAIFGVGLDRVVCEPQKSYIDRINASSRLTVSIDVPSGLNADTGEVMGSAIKADYTLTMAGAKKGCLVDKARAWVGKLEIIDIGLGVRRGIKG